MSVDVVFGQFVPKRTKSHSEEFCGFGFIAFGGC